MTTQKTVFGFRVVGCTARRRRLVNAAAALAAYAACDPRAEVEKEGYLSAFWFGPDFDDYLSATGSPKGYRGVCWSPYVLWDVDHPEDPGRALREARALAGVILDRYRPLAEDDLLLFFSGAKGYHVGLPTFWGPAPSVDFNRVARLFAERLAALAGVTIDRSVYDKVRLFRAPNSRHPKTNLHKRRLNHNELMSLSVEDIRRLARQPVPFAPPVPAAVCDRAAQDWQDALADLRRQTEAAEQRRATATNGAPRLNRLTLEFIRDGASVGDRHRLLFSVAANLAEFGCPPALAHALLTEAALDSGLTPGDVRRQIECGLAHTTNQDTPEAQTEGGHDG
jgi:hypothetical protein